MKKLNKALGYLSIAIIAITGIIVTKSVSFMLPVVCAFFIVSVFCDD